MAKAHRLETGNRLEARVQRLFMCQGAFAERGLFLRASRANPKLVTDLDVVSHDYSINFHHRRIYAECKGGGNVSTLDRVVWVRGVKEIIAADYCYLILDHCDSASCQFARGEEVEILQGSGLEALETALRIPADFWPGRSNLYASVPIEESIRDIMLDEATDHFPRWLSRAQDVWREASQLLFSYGRLNSLISTIQGAKQFIGNTVLAPREDIAMRYALSAMMVRLSQYVLFAASDTMGMTRIDREAYIADRLSAGNLDLDQSRRVLDSALKMVRVTLSEHGIETPVTWNSDLMLAAPTHSKPFASAVERAIADGEHARILPLAIELRMFGFTGDPRASEKLLNRIRAAVALTGVVRAFVIQSLGIEPEFANGIGGRMAGVSQLIPNGATDAASFSPTNL